MLGKLLKYEIKATGRIFLPIYLALILLATMVGMVVLQTIWSGLAALWRVIQTLLL